ncbi:hypothetical protein AB685_02850 [Bacillus sp. LL01]|nr:hypothetical protein AB685_02850 [Bacillus sp. LL01]
MNVLRGWVKFPTGGDEARCFSVRDPVFLEKKSGGPGVTPGPTVKVWMGEGLEIANSEKFIFEHCLFSYTQF